MRTLLSAFLLFALIVTVAAQAPTHNVDGNWLATLEVGGAKFRLALKIHKSADGYTARFDSLDQGEKDLPIDSIVLNGDKLNFTAAKFLINYEGTLNAAGDEITGTLKQGANASPLIFKRIAERPAATTSRSSCCLPVPANAAKTLSIRKPN